MCPARQHVEVRPLCGAADLDEFIRLPHRLYRNDPCWVAPTTSSLRRFLSPATGPFFEHGEACLFLATAGGEPVGRISAHVNRAYEDVHDSETGFMGFFECIDSQSAADALFEAGADWLRSRGKKRVLGPMSFGIYDEIGVLVDGYDTLPPMLLTHNASYYQALWENSGFRKAVDWLALRSSNRDVDTDAMTCEAQRIITSSGTAMRAPQPKEVMRRAGEVFELFNSAWAGNWGHVPFSRSRFDRILKELRPALRADLMRIVEKDGELVAFMITIADLNPELQRLHGRCTLPDRLGLYVSARLRPLKKAKAVLLGVAKHMQRRHLHDAMILDTYAELVRRHPKLEVCDCSLIVEQHRAFMRGLARYGVAQYKTYRIYERIL